MSNLFLKIKNKIKNWRQGEYTTSNIAIGKIYYKHSSSANITHYIIDYCKKNKTWLIPLFGLIFAMGIFTIALLSYIRK